MDQGQGERLHPQEAFAVAYLLREPAEAQNVEHDREELGD